MESPLTTEKWMDGERHHAYLWNSQLPGVPVLALHGFTGSGLDWEPVCKALTRPCLAPDLIGHGASPAPGATHRYAMDEVVHHALQWCGDGSEWIVIGYSMGGRVAIRLAQLLGERLKGLVLISSSPGIEDDQLRSERMVQDSELADSIEKKGMDWFLRYWSNHPVIRSQERIPGRVRIGMGLRRQSNRVSGIVGSLRGMGQGVVQPIWAELGRIRAPTLVISGEEDVAYCEIGERLAKAVVNGRHVVVPNVGHCAHLEDTDRVVRVIMDWGMLNG